MSSLLAGSGEKLPPGRDVWSGWGRSRIVLSEQAVLDLSRGGAFRMGTRGLRPLLAAAVLTGWAAAAAAQDDALTPESLKQLLTVMGYEPRDVGNGVCEVAFDRD